jgi:hypothetical protein
LAQLFAGKARVSDFVRFAAYCLLAATALVHASRSRDGRFSAAVGIVAATLGLALVLGFAGDLANLGRDTARSEGWYEDRRSVQALVVLAAVGSAFLACMAALVFMPRRVGLRNSVLLALLTALCCYLAVHAISFHQLDSVLNRETAAGIRTGDWVEITLVAAMLLAVVTPGVRTTKDTHGSSKGSGTARRPRPPQNSGSCLRQSGRERGNR